MTERRDEAGDAGRGHTRKVCEAVPACSSVWRAMARPDAFQLTGCGGSRRGEGGGDVEEMKTREKEASSETFQMRSKRQR